MRNEARAREGDPRSRIAGVIFASRVGVALSGTLVLGACAHVNPERAFHDVSDAVSARTGQSPRWARTDSAAKDADEASRAARCGRRDARSEVRESRDLMVASRELAEFYRSVLLPQRSRALDLTLLHYNMMLKGNYDLLFAATRIQAGTTIQLERSHEESMMARPRGLRRMCRTITTTVEAGQVNRRAGIALELAVVIERNKRET